MQEIYALSTITTTTTTNNTTASTTPAATAATSTTTTLTTTTPTATAHTTTLTPHILRKFGWGNMSSLYDIPLSKGIDIQHAACKFHKAYYLPHNAKLVLVSPLSIEESIQLVINSFSMWRAEPSLTTTTATTTTDITDIQDTTLESASPPPAKRTRKSNTTNNNTNNTTSNSTSNTSNTNNIPTTVNLSFPLLTEILAPFEGRNPFMPESYSQITRVVSIKNTHKVYTHTLYNTTLYCFLYNIYIYIHVHTS